MLPVNGSHWHFSQVHQFHRSIYSGRSIFVLRWSFQYFLFFFRWSLSIMLCYDILWNITAFLFFVFLRGSNRLFYERNSYVCNFHWSHHRSRCHLFSASMGSNDFMYMYTNHAPSHGSHNLRILQISSVGQINLFRAFNFCSIGSKNKCTKYDVVNKQIICTNPVSGTVGAISDSLVQDFCASLGPEVRESKYWFWTCKLQWWV